MAAALHSFGAISDHKWEWAQWMHSKHLAFWPGKGAWESWACKDRQGLSSSCHLRSLCKFCFSCSCVFHKGKSQNKSYWTSLLTSLLRKPIPGPYFSHLSWAAPLFCHTSAWLCVQEPNKVWTARTKALSCVPVHSSSLVLLQKGLLICFCSLPCLCRSVLSAQHSLLVPLTAPCFSAFL